MLSPKDLGSHLMLCSSAIAVKILILLCPSGALADSFSTIWKVVKMERKVNGTELFSQKESTLPMLMNTKQLTHIPCDSLHIPGVAPLQLRRILFHISI